MAEDIRDGYTDGMNASAAQAMRGQCHDQWERCLYTSNSLLIWLRMLRKIRIGLVVLPIVFGALASWDLLTTNHDYKIITAILALMAGLVPAVYAALKLDEHIPTCGRLAGEYKNLEILFKDLGNIGPHKSFAEFEEDYKAARGRLEAVNAEAYTAPEWCFKQAREKIKAGHYTFDHEEGRSEQKPAGSSEVIQV